jgi:WD40 repeat protein
MSLDRRGRRLAAVDYPRGRAIVLDLNDPGNKLVLKHPGVSGCWFSADGRWAVTCGSLKGKVTTRVWDTSDGKPLPWKPPAGEGFAFFTPDSRRLVTSRPGDAPLRFWQLGSWQRGPTLPRHSPANAHVLPSPDGTLLSWGGVHQPLSLTHAGTGKQLATLEPPRDAGTTGFWFSPDGTRLAVATGNHTIHVWDLRAIRRGLARLGLDWDLPAYPPAHRKGDARPLRVEVRPPGPAPQ